VDAGPDATPPPLAYVSPFAGSGALGTFTAQAKHAGDLIIAHMSCGGMVAEPTMTITAPGWTWTVVTRGGKIGYWGALLVSIAPDTALATFVASDNNVSCTGGGAHVLADEFTMQAPGDPRMAVDGIVTQGTGHCESSISTLMAGEAVWAACSYDDPITGPGAGFTLSATDGQNNYSEYRVAGDPANTVEQIRYQTPGNSRGYVISVATIRPAPGS
jgi:hypothetical protein